MKKIIYLALIFMFTSTCFSFSRLAPNVSVNYKKAGQLRKSLSHKCLYRYIRKNFPQTNIVFGFRYDYDFQLVLGDFNFHDKNLAKNKEYITSSPTRAWLENWIEDKKKYKEIQTYLESQLKRMSTFCKSSQSN